MGKLATEVQQSRARRDTARSAFNTRVEHVRQELNTRSLAGRLAGKLELEAREALDEALEIARESKGIALGTAATLAFWYLRNPILSWIEGLFAGGRREEEALSEDGPDTAAAVPEEATMEADSDLEDVTNF